MIQFVTMVMTAAVGTVARIAESSILTANHIGCRPESAYRLSSLTIFYHRAIAESFLSSTGYGSDHGQSQVF